MNSMTDTKAKQCPNESYGCQPGMNARRYRRSLACDFTADNMVERSRVNKVAYFKVTIDIWAILT